MRVPFQRFGSRVRIALAMIATLAAAARADPDAVKDKDGRFAADFPAAVKRTNEIFDTEAGQVITCQVIAVDGARSYMVTYCDYPEGYVASTGAAAVHKGAAKDAANNAKGNIRSDDSRQLGEVPRRITISATTSSPQCSARTCSTRAPTSAKPPPLHGFPRHMASARNRRPG